MYSSPIEVGGRLLIASVIHDVTDHRRTEQALVQAAEEFQSVMATTMDGVLLVNDHFKIVGVNERYLAMSGYTREELLELGLAELEAADSTEEITALVAELRQRGYTRFERKHRTKDGRMLDLEVSSSYVPSDNCIFAFHRDITERKQYERSLADALELNAKVISMSPVGIIAYNARGNCVLANPAIEAMVGAPAAVLEAQNFRTLPPGRYRGSSIWRWRRSAPARCRPKRFTSSQRSDRIAGYRPLQ